MQLINRKNFFTIYCISFTVIAIAGAIVDVFDRGDLNYSQFNLFAIAVICLLGVFILSQTWRMEFLSPLVVLILQYILGVICVWACVWLTGFWEPVSQGGYFDIWISFSIPYAVGAGIYYRCLKREIRRRNEELQEVRRLSGKV